MQAIATSKTELQQQLQEMHATVEEAKQILQDVAERNHQPLSATIIAIVAALFFGLVLLVASCGDELARRGRSRNRMDAWECMEDEN